MEDEEEYEGSILMICHGPPVCFLTGDDAEKAMKAGCVWCRRVYFDEDGNELRETGPGHA